jgi:hypothetical protein
MKILLLFACAALVNPTFAAPAQKRSPNSGATGQTPHAIQMDEDFPVEALEKEGVVVHPLSENAGRSEMLSPNLQDQFFHEAGLSEFTKGWDGFEKDRLALRVENQDPKEVATRYEGRLPEPALRKLKSIIQHYRRSHK